MSFINMGGGVLDVSTASLKMWHDSAAENQAQSLRTDSRRSVAPVTAARVAIKQFALETATSAAVELRKDEAARDTFANDIIEAMAYGLGYGEVDGEIRCDSLRTDAAWFAPDALLTRDTQLIKPSYAPRMVSSSIPVRSVEAWKERYEIGAMSYSGKMTVMQPGTNDVAYANVQASFRYRDMHTFGVKTRTNWMQMMASGSAAVSLVQEQAEAARITAAEFAETALVNGVARIDFDGLKQIGCTNYYSTVNYATETNMDVLYADFVRGIQAIAVAAGDRQSPTGTGTNTMMIGTRLARALARKSNFNAGGNLTGDAFLAAIMRANASLGAAMDSAGISRIIKAPSLNGFGAANRDAALLFDVNDDRALRQVVAMTLAPVRTHENLTAKETLFVMRHGGLDLANALPIGILTVQVA
jgi:hypothetical protein